MRKVEKRKGEKAIKLEIWMLKAQGSKLIAQRIKE